MNDPIADIPLQKPRLVCFRTLDAAEEFDLQKASRLLLDQVVSRAAFRTVKPEHLQVNDPPLLIRMGHAQIPVLEATLQASVLVKLYPTGLVSVAFWMDLPEGLGINAVPAMADALTQSAHVDTLATQMAGALLKTIAAAVRDPRGSLGNMEDYVVLLVGGLGGGATVDQLRRHPAVAALVLGEPGLTPALSPQMQQDALRGAITYYADDLTVVDWNAALVLDSRSSGEDVVDLLEFATQQLVGFRYYDALVDGKLSGIYGEFEVRSRSASSTLVGSPYADLARQLMLLRVELTGMTEKIDNAIKLVGEPSLARVYAVAVDKFRVAEWRRSVEEKLALVDALVALVRGESATGKSHMLEWLVVGLILVEIIMGLFRG
jgi:hypothetical protein